MTKAQYQREKIRQVQEARERELQMLAEGRMSANPVYVRNAADFLWSRILDRKLQRRDSLPPIERQRLTTLVSLSV